MSAVIAKAANIDSALGKSSLPCQPRAQQNLLWGKVGRRGYSPLLLSFLEEWGYVKRTGGILAMLLP
jgi:hypothetical protein